MKMATVPTRVPPATCTDNQFACAALAAVAHVEPAALSVPRLPSMHAAAAHATSSVDDIEAPSVAAFARPSRLVMSPRKGAQ